MKVNEVETLEKNIEKKLKQRDDEIEKLREAARSCDADLLTKCKHGRKNLSEYVSPETK